jgi:hypothetical protein
VPMTSDAGFSVAGESMLDEIDICDSVTIGATYRTLYTRYQFLFDQGQARFADRTGDQLPVPISRTRPGLSTGARASLPNSRTAIECCRSAIRVSLVREMTEPMKPYRGVLVQTGVTFVSQLAQYMCVSATNHGKLTISFGRKYSACCQP